MVEVASSNLVTPTRFESSNLYDWGFFYACNIRVLLEMNDLFQFNISTISTSIKLHQKLYIPKLKLLLISSVFQTNIFYFNLSFSKKYCLAGADGAVFGVGVRLSFNG